MPYALSGLKFAEYLRTADKHIQVADNFMQNNQLKIDTHAIELTASVHQVTKFRIFELAYQDWHGTEANETDIEAHFIAFLFDGLVPCWVRAYTRKTLRLCEEAGLDLPALPADKPDVALAISAQSLLMIAGLTCLCLAQLFLLH